MALNELISLFVSCPQKYSIILGFATLNLPYRMSQQQAADIAEKAFAVKEVYLYI